MEQIYRGKLRFYIKATENGQKPTSLMVSASLRSSSSSFDKEFVLRLTDESDPFFYFYLKLSDDDYQSLRVQQGLLVDFLAFPKKFVDLLQLCHKEELNESPKLVVGSDSDVKNYLAQQLHSLKECNEKLSTDLKTTETSLRQQLRDTQLNSAAQQTELDRLRTEIHEQTILLNDKWSQLLLKEQEKSSQIQTALQEQHKNELETLNYEHDRSVRQSRESSARSECRLAELNEKRIADESTIQELRRRMVVLDDELCSLRQEHQFVKQEKLQLEAVRVDLEQTTVHSNGKVAALEHELRECKLNLSQVQTALETTQEQKKRLTEELECQYAVVDKRENSIKMLSEEVNKGNDIIRKLQGEIKSLHAKLKLRNKVAEEQEKVVNEKDILLGNLQRNRLTLEDELLLKSKQVKDLEATVESFQAKVEESTKLLKTNENVINWLNKQLNECQVDKKKQIATDQRTLGGGPFCAFPYATSTPSEEAAVAAGRATSGGQTQPTATAPWGRKIMDVIPEHPNSPLNEKENNLPLSEKYLHSNAADPGNVQPKKCLTGRLPRMSVAPPAAGKQLAATTTPNLFKFNPSAYFPM